jgi:2-desacetyl-2-hydroxyethyl bacteriochlorophyllide A dehydrogenase
MKAAIIRDNQFVVDEIPTPVPGPGQVLTKVRSCGICGSDVHIFKHAKEVLETFIANGLISAEQGANADLVLGHEFVAEVVEFGPETRQTLAVGDRVCSIPFIKQGDELVSLGATPAAPGAYAEYLLLTEELLVPVPENLSDEAAALAEPLAVGVHAVAKSNINEEECALVIGCGPIGLATIAALKMQGVEKIIVADYSAKRREIASLMGASLAINPSEQSPYEALASIQPEGHVVFECVGRSGMLSQIIEQVPKHTRIIAAGLSQGEDSFTPVTALIKELQIQFVIYYSPEEFSQALQALADGHVDWQHWVSSKVNLEGVANAFVSLQDPEQETKILIEPWS